MNWLQLRIDTSRTNAPAIEQAAESCGAIAVTLQDNADQPIYEPGLGETPLWHETRVTALFAADTPTEKTLYALQQLLPQMTVEGRWQILEDKDWTREWMQHYQPIECAENFWICPSWSPPPKPDAINLLLDPGLAFGTGTHPTTFQCLKWLAGEQLKEKTLIDYGCGSGILGIAALLLGARQVSGVDIDPQALYATCENVLRNNLAPESFPVNLPEKAKLVEADVVVANILAGPLVELAPKILALIKPGGSLCLSGILKTQETAIIDAYSGATSIDKVMEQEGWLCIACTKKVDNNTDTQLNRTGGIA